MISKSEVKYIQTLSQKKTRDREVVFIAEGVKVVEEFLANNRPYRKIYATGEWIEENPGKDAVEVEEFELKKISQFTTPQKVLMIAEKKPQISSLDFANKITLALDGIQDPGNLGTIIRICDWMGVSQIIASEDTADQYNPKVVQASMGSIMRINMMYTDLNVALKNAEVKIFGTALSGKNIFQIEDLKEGIVVIGNESKGIREPLLSLLNETITIPRKGDAESLNAAVATGIILSQLTLNRSGSKT